MSNIIFSNRACRNCGMFIDGVCTAAAYDGWMTDSETGEILDVATTLVIDWSGRELTVCGACAQYNGFFCEDDGKYHTDAVYNNSDWNYYTQSYADEYMRQCINCGDWYDIDDMHSDGCGGWYCSDCERDCLNPIKSYHYHHGDFSKIGDWSDNRTIGFELETDGLDYYLFEAANTIDSEFRGELFLEEDCSLYEGFEIISQPHTVPALAALDIERVIEILNDYGASSNPYTAGLHLHFARDWFGETSDERAETIARVIVAYRNNWDVLCELSNRDDYDRIEKYASKPNGGEDIDEIIRRNSWSRYHAVNLENSKTIEFRLGAGFLDAEYIRGWISLHIELIEAARRGDANITVNYDYSITSQMRRAA